MVDEWRAMQIEKHTTGDLLIMALSGLLDNDSSVHFRDEIESCKRQGWHRIVVDLGGVTYLSSAGIGTLLTARKQLTQLNGLFGIFNATPEVETVLRQVRLLETLSCDPQTAQAARASGSMTMALSSSTRIASDEGLDMEIYSLSKPPPLSCTLIGQPASLFAAATCESHRISFAADSFGIGLGTLDADNEVDRSRIGEIISVAGAVAQSPQINGGLPDYSVAAADFVPTARLLYGLHWSGEFPTLIRFEPSQRGEQVRLSTLIRQSMKQTDTVAAAFVILADCAGLVGAQIRRTPEAVAAADASRFQVPEVRDWLSYGAERLHRHNLTLIAGIATTGELDPASPLRPFVRRLDRDGTCSGHFHSAVFPYRPLKKRTLRMQVEVADLFESGAVEDVLHLLRDDRPITGSGETELLSGACWIGSVESVAAGEIG